ncbi:ABC transporter permease, partial [Enterocloster hominis (ex Hitch et al. 2024)]
KGIEVGYMGAKSQKKNINTQIIFTLTGLLILCVFFSITTKSFLTQRNLLNIATQTSVAVIVAIAETYIIASGCIDLSVGAGVAFSGLVVASAMKAGIPVPAAMLLALGTGMALGAFNAFVITVLGIVPFIATLGTNSIFRGIVLVIMDGVPMSGLKSEFTWIGSGKLWGWLPWAVVFMAVIAVVMAILLKKSKFGRYVYAIGSNEQAAYLSGIPVNRIKVLNYVISGALVAFAGMLLAARVSSAAPTAGDLYETNAIAASVIGGATLSGGKGSIAGTIVGAFIIGVLSNGLNLIGLNYFWQQVAIGVVIISAVFLEVVRERLKK